MANPKAYSTINTILKAGATVSALAKLCKIKSYPDLMGAPETVESTDLEDTFQTFVPGVQSNDSLEFTCNYNPTDFDSVESSAGTEQTYQLEMGVSGSQGRFRWTGVHTVRVTGAEVNAVREMVITIVPSSAIEALAAPDPVPSVTLSDQSIEVADGSTDTLTATVVPSGSAVTWSSDDTTIATVSASGVVTGVAAGVTTVVATIKVDGTEYSDYCAVTVTE